MAVAASSLRSPLQAWIIAIRVHTLPASLVPVIVGASMAYTRGAFSLLPFLAIGLAALLIQVGTNLANDVFDYEKGVDSSDRRGHLRVTQAGLISPRTMKQATALTLILALLIGIYLVTIGGLPILLIGLFSILFALLYTAGPYPIAYSFFGELFVLIFFGPIAVGGTFYILSGTITPGVLLIGTALGLISSAILVVNNLRDIPSDSQTGKKTLAVRFGAQFARWEFLTLMVSAGLLPPLVFLVDREHSLSMLASLYLIPCIAVIRTVFTEQDADQLNRALEQTGKLLILFGLLFIIGQML